MKLKELLTTPIGALAMASIQNYPELEKITPAVSANLRDFAAENGYPLEALICAVLNILATQCDDAPSKTKGIPDDLETDPTVN